MWELLAKLGELTRNDPIIWRTGSQRTALNTNVITDNGRIPCFSVMSWAAASSIWSSRQSLMLTSRWSQQLSINGVRKLFASFPLHWWTARIWRNYKNYEWHTDQSWFSSTVWTLSVLLQIELNTVLSQIRWCQAVRALLLLLQLYISRAISRTISYFILSGSELSKRSWGAKFLIAD